MDWTEASRLMRAVPELVLEDEDGYKIRWSYGGNTARGYRYYNVGTMSWRMCDLKRPNDWVFHSYSVAPEQPYLIPPDPEPAPKPQHPRICDMPVGRVFEGKVGTVEGVFLMTYNGLVSLDSPNDTWEIGNDCRPTEYKPVEDPKITVWGWRDGLGVKIDVTVKQG